MKNIIKASIFKLFKDKTFRVTLIVGAVLAVLLSLLYMGINKASSSSQIGTGGYMFITSFTPVTNFGIAIPINLIIMIVGEFTYGTIRNKVIVGYRKSYIYFALFLIGLIFTFFLLLAYVGLAVLFGSILNGGWGNIITGPEIGKYLAIGLSGYVFITSVSLFFSSLCRHQGAAIGLTILILIICMIAALVSVATCSNLNDLMAAYWINPLFAEAMTSIGGNIPHAMDDLLKDQYMAPGILSPLIYAVVFYTAGTIIFMKKDLK